MQTACAPYTPRSPRLSDYYRCVEDSFEELERVHEERYQSRFGYLKPEIRLTIFRYLDCGCLHNGFARVKCDDCGHEYQKDTGASGLVGDTTTTAETGARAAGDYRT